MIVLSQVQLCISGYLQERNVTLYVVRTACSTHVHLYIHTPYYKSDCRMTEYITSSIVAMMAWGFACGYFQRSKGRCTCTYVQCTYTYIMCMYTLYTHMQISHETQLNVQAHVEYCIGVHAYMNMYSLLDIHVQCTCIPSVCSWGKAFQRVLMRPSSICSARYCTQRERERRREREREREGEAYCVMMVHDCTGVREHWGCRCVYLCLLVLR